MNQRERTLLLVIGGAVGLYVLYQCVNFLFISPVTDSRKRIAELREENDRLENVVRQRRRLVRTWLDAASKTFSYDRAITSNQFGKSLKEVAQRHGFEAAFFTPASGTKIGNKTSITTVAYRIVAEGPFDQARALVNELYRTPYLSQITKLSMSPIQMKGRMRDEVKLELTIETPVLPEIDKKKMPDAALAVTMAEAHKPGETPPPPAREALPDEAMQAILAKRNIFKTFLPPPENVVLIDNQDLKMVALKVTFFWEGQAEEPIVETVAGMSQKPVKGMGDSVEVMGSYADGKAFGPERLDFNVKKEWTYVVKSHTPPPPPVYVDLAVENATKDPVEVEVTVTGEDGKTKTLPTMRIKPGRTDIDEFKAQRVAVTATYPSGKKLPARSYVPGAGKQTYVVPVESAEVRVEAPVAVNDPPPDATMSVSGLVTYQGTQELIATGGATRKIIPAGAHGAVDSGTLLAVHPRGGVVKMPSGNYYLYPLGRKFSERVKLNARSDGDLAAAIDAWLASPEAQSDGAEAVQSASAAPPPTPMTPAGKGLGRKP
ncbi:MAG: hypothetical protein HBSAPP02_09110 [Phycisphaerae bacterium]|nr:MAG: hypothetical protein HRU71_13170 [Planctomycetia bacterium]RIK71518.1 MAG: hypothetical protein DCC66_00855 [Planctomycetota bacterium]GJQ25879.1 MAG: hypothetical protein HBSAPP02_09110 [Phycisphaerae bacterium]